MSVFSMPEEIMPAIKSQVEFYDDMSKLMLHMNFPAHPAEYSWFGVGEDLPDLSTPGAFALASSALLVAAAGQAVGTWIGLADTALSSWSPARPAGSKKSKAAPAARVEAPKARPAASAPERQVEKAVSSKGVSLAAPRASNGALAKIGAVGEGGEADRKQLGEEPR